MLERLLGILRRRRSSTAHAFARDFWENCENSFLASDPNYYRLQEEALRSFLSEVGPVASALDVGCGNGKFSFVLADTADEVSAFDLSPKLIDQANAEKQALGVGNISFEVRDLERGVARQTSIW